MTAKEFADYIDDVLARARAAGVGSVIVVSETLDDAKRFVSTVVSARYALTRACEGCWPWAHDTQHGSAVCWGYTRYKTTSGRV